MLPVVVIQMLVVLTHMLEVLTACWIWRGWQPSQLQQHIQLVKAMMSTLQLHSMQVKAKTSSTPQRQTAQVHRPAVKVLKGIRALLWLQCSGWICGWSGWLGLEI